MTKSIEQHGLEAWADTYFPVPTYKAKDLGLELYLRDRCVRGSGLFKDRATSTNQRLNMLAAKTDDIYTQYFLQSAKLENLQAAAPNFVILCSAPNGYRYTNEFQYCTVLRDQVDPAVVERARELLLEFGIQVP
jgi:negative regulator of genetic competence, sporulation and motility